MLVELGVVEQRYAAVLEVLGGVPVTEAAAHAGVTRQTVHRWLKAYAARGLAGLVDGSKAPGSSGPNRLSAVTCSELPEVDSKAISRRISSVCSPVAIGIG